jgi:predicted house-cleaning noncanonical NTP pyrophosphatase (MazG superfamily)
MHSDKQIESWVNQMKGIVKDHGRSKEQKESDLDDLEEQIKDRLEDQNLNFGDDYMEDVMRRLVDLRGLDSLPS